ncbi:MAG: hypothetical protein ABSC13_03690 [Dehalococcoidia bacterium]|jgi:hypothetical protein
MNDKDDKELKNPKSWDWEQAERRVGRKKPRAVVSVAFKREDFDSVAHFAERAGMKLSEFIRSAAIGCAEGKNGTESVTGGSPDASSTNYLPPSPFTRANSQWQCKRFSVTMPRSVVSRRRHGQDEGRG